MPLYILFASWVQSNALYIRTTGRPVDPADAQAVLPGILLGYVLPTVMMFSPWESKTAWQNMIVWWQLSPGFAGLAVWLISKLLRAVRTPSDWPEAEEYRNKDVGTLRFTYGFSALSTAAVHVWAVRHVVLTPGMTLWSTFLEMPYLFGPWDPITTPFSVLKYDMALAVAAVLIWCLYVVYSMRAVGYVTTAQAVRAAVAVLASLVLAGPGAMISGLWYWREGKIAGLCKIKP
jgi:hypothetical protein